MALIFHLWNSKTQPALTSSLLAWWGSGPRVPPLCRLIRFYSCNVLTICHSLIRGNGLSLNCELRSSNQVCCLPLQDWGEDRRWPDISLAFREFSSILPVSLQLGTVICNDGWADAWKSRASQTTHQDFLIGVPAVSSGRQMAAMVSKSDS